MPYVVARQRCARRSLKSVAVGGIDLVELPEQRRPFEHAEAAAHSRLIQSPRFVHDIGRRPLQLYAARKRGDLYLTGALEPEHTVECLRNARADGKQAVISQDHAF